MPDYGHDLQFGTFITPQSERPEDVVALARVTEAAGLDLATFQDHPYQPALLDAWTLVSWVAAETETLRVAPNVLNLPLRPPAVIGRAAASLDRLSGGRVELGLGAGAFWDGVAAMGGPRRTPGESVAALSEAIDVIRQVWDTTERGGVRVDGEHYSVRGAKRGPAPAHDIGIWLGAYKPRMLRLTGRKADGWLPSLSYMQPDDLGPSNRTIDDAARAAGRDPREIRRLINVGGAFLPSRAGFLRGTPDDWVADLLGLALEHGFSTFILSGDDPAAIQAFGRDVAPALRDAVARERRDRGTPTGRARGAAALAQRHGGIDYDALPESLAGKAIEPGDRDYGKVRSTYIRRGSPGLVIQAQDAGDVRAALAYARAQSVPLAIRSGGHGIGGRSTNDGGIVLDVGALDGVELLDRATGRVRLGPGARWGEVAVALRAHGLAISSGDYGGVGVGGLATAGGIGFLARKHGLTIDHVVAAELVLADGRLVRTDAEHEPELLWAVRGAGGNFGVVTAIELEAGELGDVVFSMMAFDARDPAPLLERWAAAVEAAPRELTSFLTVFEQRGGSHVAQLYTVYASDDTVAATEALTPLLHVGQLLDQQAQLAPYPALLPSQGGVHTGGPEPVFRGGLLEHVDADAARILADGIRSGAAPMLQVRAVGGAVNDVDPLATAYAHRTQNFSVNAVGGSLRADALDAVWDELRPHISGIYISFDTDPRPERLHDAFPGETLTRLRRLKAQYDPDNVFDQNRPIPPAA
jgi:alkanesulfonate monooxygenase SsuD/methylene tetrahydromethanopterin reductase-like flavin-dependent oxidoreductase (luciferase family)